MADRAGIRPLTVAKVRTAGPGVYGDLHGLRLRVKASGSRQWVWRGTVRGKRRDVGLGGYPYVTLAEARDKAFEYRKIARAGGDPTANQSGAPTFAEAVEIVIALHEPTWKHGAKSADQWRASLRDYAMPTLGERTVDTITPFDVMGTLTPIWTAKHETARRVRQRISAVMQWAVAQGYRADDPAGDVIRAALPKPNGATKHHRALPHANVGAAVATIRASGAAPATRLAFEFLVLTATRSGEVRGARWAEIDLDAATWTVPAARMKAKRDHRVPLSGRALEILTEARELSDGTGLVFPSPTGRALSDATMSKLLRENGVDAVPHGFRSSFRDWAADLSDAPRDVAEAALAHTVKGVEGVYKRTDLFDRRRALMEEWSAYVGA